MNLANSLKRAQALGPGSKAAAADLYADIETELALGDPSPEDEQQGEQALSLIRERFPDAQEQADTRANGRAPQISRTARKNAQPDETRPATNQRAPKKPSSEGRQRGGTRKTPSTQPSRSRTYRPRRQVIRAAKAVDQASGSWAGDIWDWILGGVGLSLFFLVLSHPTGLTNLMTGGTNAIRWIVDPTIDPLRPPATHTTKK